MDEADIDAIIQQCSLTSNTDEVIPATGMLPPDSHTEFCLSFAERAAKRYLKGDLSFTEADIALNWLYAISYVSDTAPGEMPDLALQIYDAFDSGEYYHSDDEPDVDPELKYTLPRIKELIES